MQPRLPGHRSVDFEQPRAFLGGLSPVRFLAEHWQKTPRLCRGAVSTEPLRIARSTLCELATHADVEARLVEKREQTWDLHPGPFSARQLRGLGTVNWTVLVSDLDEHVPELQPLLDHLDFLPSWRIDDIMGSYAVPGGSVGPHYDSYDVFLLQAQGTRRWQLSSNFDREALRADSDLKILSDFRAEQEWDLGPGDLLYLPPHVAHHGVATSADCITLSLGARAPGLQELLTHVASELIEQAPRDLHLSDPDRTIDARGTQLSPVDVERAYGLFTHHLTPNRAAFTRALGCLLSQPKALFAESAAPVGEDEADASLRGSPALVRCRGSRWLWWHDGGTTTLFVSGQAFASNGTSPEFLAALCSARRHPRAVLDRWMQHEVHEALLRDLVRDGWLIAGQGSDEFNGS